MTPRRFRPSRDGFRYRNAFARAPVLAFGPIRIGNAGNGLCGGMVFAAADYFAVGRTIPPDVEPARPTGAAYRYLVRRLFAAFNLPGGVFRYWRWMLRSDEDVLARTRSGWAAVRARLDAGESCPLGIVTVRGLNPSRLRHNHVVLAYAYRADEDATTVSVYDPNTGPSDDVTITFDRAAIASTVDVGHSIRGFFALRYRPRRPPP